MKTRAGFVSNSSTCSFQIYGVTFESPSEMFDSMKSTAHIEAMREKILKKVQDSGELDDPERDLTKLSAVDLIKLACEEVGDYMIEELTYDLDESLVPGLGVSRLGDYDYSTYVGRNFSGIGEDETPRQLKDGVVKALTEIFGEEVATAVAMHDGTYQC